MKIKPAEGCVAVEFIDADAPAGLNDDTKELALATVLGVGAKVTGVKAGDTVAIYQWAREAPCIGNVCIVRAYDVCAVIGG